MNNYRTKFSKEELNDALHKNDKKASEIIEDGKKWSSFKCKFQSFLKKAKNIPVLRNVIDDLVTMIDLVNAYVQKEYIQIPIGTVISIVAALIYVISPVDLIPDCIPVVGFVDDVAVIMFVLKLGVAEDLDKFRIWKNNKLSDCIDDFSITLAKVIAENIVDDYLAAVVLMSDDTIKILVSKENECYDVVCNVIVLKLPKNILQTYDIITLEQTKSFLKKVFSHKEICWIDGVDKEVFFEPDFDSKWDNFIIEED